MSLNDKLKDTDTSKVSGGATRVNKQSSVKAGISGSDTRNNNSTGYVTGQGSANIARDEADALPLIKG